MSAAASLARIAAGRWPLISLPLTVLLLGALIYRLLQPEPGPIDLAVYRAAGEALLAGSPSIYAPDFGQQTGTFLPFTYPPISALLATGLTVFPLAVDYVIWTGVSAFLLARYVWHELQNTAIVKVTGLVLRIAIAYWQLPVTETLVLGQLGILLTLGCIVASTSNRSWPAALVGLLAAVKLTPLLFIVYFAVTRQWSRLAWSGGCFVALTSIGFLLLPTESLEYFTQLISDSNRVGDTDFYANQSLAGLAARMGLGHGLWLAMAAVVAVGGL